jgi:2'-5' RNA ligase
MNNAGKAHMKFKRLFIAVEVKPDDSFLSWYAQVQAALQGEEVRWVKPDNFHITLRFLGDTDIEFIPEITAALHRSVVLHKPFPIFLSGIGIFRSLSYPKVLWTGIKKSEELILIKESIDLQLKAIINSNVNVNAGFNPHLTLGRMKRVKDLKIWKELISRYWDHEFFEVEVQEIVLFESILDRYGPVYKAIEVIPFPR